MGLKDFIYDNTFAKPCFGGNFQMSFLRRQESTRVT